MKRAGRVIGGPKDGQWLEQQGEFYHAAVLPPAPREVTDADISRGLVYDKFAYKHVPLIIGRDKVSIGVLLPIDDLNFANTRLNYSDRDWAVRRLIDGYKPNAKPESDETREAFLGLYNQWSKEFHGLLPPPHAMIDHFDPAGADKKVKNHGQA